MTYQIDQSHKIEQTEKDTILALSNDVQFAIRLAAKEKRLLQDLFRASAEPEVFIYFVFAALLAILLVTVKPNRKVYVDHEYLGHEDIIKLKLTAILRKMNLPVEVGFCYVGKASPAHALAAKIATGKLKANRTITANDILKYISPKEKDRVSQTGPWDA